MIGQRKTPQFTFLCYIFAMAFVMLGLSYLAPGRVMGDRLGLQLLAAADPGQVIQRFQGRA